MRSSSSQNAWQRFEGNQAFNFDGENTWGGAFLNTVFRNHLTGKRRSVAPLTLTDSGYMRGVSLARGHWYYNVAGNVIGQPSGSALTAFEQTAPPWTDIGSVWKLGPDVSNWNAPADARVLSTLLRGGNFDYVTDSVRWESIAAQALPDSLYLTGRPAFFGSTPWPWVDPVGPTKTFLLPARWRFDNPGAPLPSPTTVSGATTASPAPTTTVAPTTPAVAPTTAAAGTTAGGAMTTVPGTTAVPPTTVAPTTVPGTAASPTTAPATTAAAATTAPRVCGHRVCCRTFASWPLPDGWTNFTLRLSLVFADFDCPAYDATLSAALQLPATLYALLSCEPGSVLLNVAAPQNAVSAALAAIADGTSPLRDVTSAASSGGTVAHPAPFPWWIVVAACGGALVLLAAAIVAIVLVRRHKVGHGLVSLKRGSSTASYVQLQNK